MQNDTAIDLPSRQTAHSPFSGALESFYSDLDWRTIHAMFSHQDFNPSYKWISEKVGCSIEKVANCIEGLITLGILKRTSEGFEVIKKDFVFNELGEISSEMRIEMHSLLTQQIAQKREDGVFGLDRVLLVAANKDLIKEFNETVVLAFAELRKKSLTVKSDGVYGIAMMGTDLIKGGK